MVCCVDYKEKTTSVAISSPYLLVDYGTHSQMKEAPTGGCKYTYREGLLATREGIEPPTLSSED